MAQDKKIAVTIFLAAFIYYCLLSAKQYTWVFTSGDSGEFMAMAHYWSAPHLFGMPLYQALSHLVNLLPGSLEWKMPILLSALPAAVTVALVYLIVKKLSGNMLAAVIAPVVLIGAAVFTSEAQVIKEYALATMLLTLSLYFYINDRKALAIIAIGLGSAIHMMIVAVAVLWFLLQWRQVAKYIPLYIMFGIFPYGLTLWELGNSSPPLIAGGGLSFETVNAYLGSSGIAGSLGIWQAPARAFNEVKILLVSLGLAIIPIVIGLFKPWTLTTKMLIVAIAFPVWYYLSCLDPTTWTYLSFGMPFLAIAAGIGLARMNLVHSRIILIGAIVLVLANSYMLNSSRLDAAEPIATGYYQSIDEIPDGSVVVVHRGGFYGSGLFYAMSKGKDIIPVYYRYENKKNILWWQYTDWMQETYPLEGNSTQRLIQSALEQDIEVYALLPLLEGWPEVLELESYNEHFGKVIWIEDKAVYSPLYESD